MPDISMCINRTCPSKLECYRYIATPNPLRQSYARFELKEGEVSCGYFWPIYTDSVSTDKSE
jgi:hypothetical protein